MCSSLCRHNGCLQIRHNNTSDKTRKTHCMLRNRPDIRVFGHQSRDLQKQQCGVNMATAAAGSRPLPTEPGTNRGTIHSCPNGSVPNSGQQDSGLQSSSQDTGPSSHPQQHLSSRPIFYVPAPPPAPPFLQYQWPMSFYYNPFAGVPGMGYGMVIPPFAPPYMEPSTYILPHPHIHPVDYRRMLQPQVPAPSAPFQNPNYTRRIRLPHTVPVRETVNSAVQTEPTQRHGGHYGDGSPPMRSDSGHGTTSDSPSSSSSSSQKQGSDVVDNYTSTSNHAKDLQANMTCTSGTGKHSRNILTAHPANIKITTSCIRATVEKQKGCKDSQTSIPRNTNGHCNMWSVDSPGSMVPVCSSSQQEDEVVKECGSFPDILMSWGGGTPQATMQKNVDKECCESDNQLPSCENEVEQSVCQSTTEPKNGSVAAENIDADESENDLCSKDSLSESRRIDELVGLVDSRRQSLLNRDELLSSLNKSHYQDEDETNPTGDPTEIIPYQMILSSCQMKRKLNESIWSVESLPPFIPPKDLLLQKINFDSEIIMEMTEEAEKCGPATPNNSQPTNSSKERIQSDRISSSDSVPMSDSWLDFSSLAVTPISPPKKSETESDATEVTEPKQGHVMAPADNSPPPCEVSLLTPAAEEVDENRSSEPEAIQSPNQECVIENEGREKSPSCPPQTAADEVILQNGTDKSGTSRNDETNQLSNKQADAPMCDQRKTEVSLSKGRLVDCGVQCTNLLPCTYHGNGEESRTPPFKYSGMKRDDNCRAEGFNMNRHLRINQRRNRGGNGRKQW